MKRMVAVGLILLLTACHAPEVTPPQPPEAQTIVPTPEPTPTPTPDPEPPAIVLPELQLNIAQIAARQGQLRVTLLGDSITEGANIDPAQSWAVRWASELKSKFPNTQVYNRAIGARSSANYLNADYVGMSQEPDTLDSGYGPRNSFDHGRDWVIAGQSWHDAVKATKPNLLIIAFGMNEVWAADTSLETIKIWKKHLTTILDDVATWQPKPDVVIMTPILASTVAPDGLPVIPRERLYGIADASRSIAGERGNIVIDIQAAWKISPYTETQLLGTWPGTWNGIEGGGNGYNHPTLLATNEIFRPTVQAFSEKWLP